MSELVLARIDKAKAALLQVKSAQEARKVIAMADAARVYAKEVGASSELVNFAGEIRLRAERRLGEVLKEQPKARGAAAGGKKDGPRGSYVAPRDKTPTLAESGLTKKQSSRAQMLAAVPEGQFEKRLEKAKAAGELVPSRFAKEVARERKISAREKALEGAKDTGAPTGRYRVIYADPPWDYRNAGLTEYGHADTHYPTMTLEEICALPVKEWTEKNAVLFLWATSPMLEVAFQVINAWGFEYKTSFVWDKVKHNFGHYNSVRHEFLLVATRGSCKPDTPELFDSVQTIERSSKHSEKPEEFRRIIETLYFRGARLELFAREERKGWAAHGKQIAT